MYSGMCTVLNVNAKDVRGHSRDELVGTTPRHCLPRHPAEGGLKGGGGGNFGYLAIFSGRQRVAMCCSLIAANVS